MNRYVSYLDSIMVDEQQHARIMRSLRSKAKSSRRSRVALRYAGVAACVVILTVFAFAVFGVLGNFNIKSPYSPGIIIDPNEKPTVSLVGLPVNNFSLAELEDFNGAADIRVGYAKISDFFRYREPPCFVFVRVIETERWTDTEGPWDQKRQTSTVHVIDSVYSEVKLPVAIRIIQSEYVSYTDNDKTNLVREGGVYLLPLFYWEDTDTWVVQGDIDVLFEVDDRGLIWSHSWHDGFMRFDGQDANVVAGFIRAMTSDESFPVATSPFGFSFGGGSVLVKTTILSVTHSTSRAGYDQFTYLIRIDDVVSEALSLRYTPLYVWPVKKGDEIRIVVSFISESLEQGEQYLLVLEPWYDILDIRAAAAINGNGTITAALLYQGNSLFTAFNGLSIAQIKEETERAKSWHTTYAK